VTRTLFLFYTQISGRRATANEHRTRNIQSRVRSVNTKLTSCDSSGADMQSAHL